MYEDGLFSEKLEDHSHIIDERIGLSSGRRIRGLDRFNTKTGVVTVVREEERYSSYLRFYRVYRELGK